MAHYVDVENPVKSHFAIAHKVVLAAKVFLGLPDFGALLIAVVDTTGVAGFLNDDLTQSLELSF